MQPLADGLCCLALDKQDPVTFRWKLSKWQMSEYFISFASSSAFHQNILLVFLWTAKMGGV